MDKRTMIETTLNVINTLRDYIMADEWGDDEIDEGVDTDWRIKQIDKAHELLEELLPEAREIEDDATVNLAIELDKHVYRMILDSINNKFIPAEVLSAIKNGTVISERRTEI